MHCRENACADSVRNPSEYAYMDNVFTPLLHRINQVIRFRAVHPNEPVPPPYEILTKYMHPPDELMEKAMKQVEKVREVADVKKGRHFKHMYVVTVANY